MSHRNKGRTPIARHAGVHQDQNKKHASKTERRETKAALAATKGVTGHECTCHRDSDNGSHELCCGHDEGRDPNCPIHGDGTQPMTDAQKTKPLLSRDIIKGALRPYIDDEELDAAVTDVVRSLAEKHLHIFKAEGRELA